MTLTDDMTLTAAELLGRSTAPIAPAGPHAPYDLVFLDRDGTLNERRSGYVDRPGDLVLLPEAVAAVRALNDSGARVVLVTNQRGVATGVLRESDLLSVQQELVRQLALGGAHLDAVHVCPHDAGSCDCRKPASGLLTAALARAPWADPARCVLFGDQETDLAAARGAAVRGIRVEECGLTVATTGCPPPRAV